MLQKKEEAKQKIKERFAAIVEQNLEQWSEDFEQALALKLTENAEQDPLKFKFPVGITLNLFEDAEHNLLSAMKASWGVRKVVVDDIPADAVAPTSAV